MLMIEMSEKPKEHLVLVLHITCTHACALVCSNKNTWQVYRETVLHVYLYVYSPAQRSSVSTHKRTHTRPNTSVFPSRVRTVSHQRAHRHCPPSRAYVLSHNPDSSPSNAFVWPPPCFSWVTAVKGRPASACWSQFPLTFLLSWGAWWRHIQSFARQTIAPVVEKCLMTRLKTTRALS